MYHHLTYKKVHLFLALLLIPIALVLAINNPKTLAAIQLQSRSDEMSNSGAGAVSIHNIGFTYTNTSTPVGSITIQYCSNSPLIGDVCVAPTGLDLTNATLASQTGNIGFSVSNISGSQLTLTRNPQNPTSTPSNYELDNITNPSSAGEYYVRFQTFSSLDGSGPFIEQGGDAIAITSGFEIDSIVPPYLTFCGGITVVDYNCGTVIGNQINFGNFSSDSTSTATSQFLVATNAQFGYNVTVEGDTLTSGIYTVTNLGVPTKIKPGLSQFGMNLVTNTSPNLGGTASGPGPGTASPAFNYAQPNLFTFNDGDVVALSNGASNYTKFTASYVVDVNGNQEPGVYATTLYYICLANF